MTVLPATPSIANAQLPERYEAAKQALAECDHIDECKDWADKAAALGSYARQADDDTLHKTAIRIQTRAIRRCGELLKTFQTGPARPLRPTRRAQPFSNSNASVSRPDCASP